MELPVGVVENEPKINMAANLGLWGESIWLPTIYVTDPRVRWEAMSGSSARLIVPFEDGEDSFRVNFDRNSSLVKSMQALRYRGAADEEKILWKLDILGWDEFNGLLVPAHATVTWADEGKPWLEIELDDLAYNEVVRNYIQGKGA